MCASMYGGYLVDKSWRWYLVENVGTWCRWKGGFWKLVGYTECLWFSGLDGCTVWLWF